MSKLDNPADLLWKDYARLFERFDDYSLARWLVQTLGHFNGELWRYSHPLVGAYKLAAQIANQRQLWLKRLVEIPAPYSVASCCRSPLFPLATRDIVESGLICIHCNETAVTLNELPAALRRKLTTWASSYGEIHRVAHLDETERAEIPNYDYALEEAAQKAGLSMMDSGEDLFPALLEQFPSIVWEDHDECLGIRPEDVVCDT